MAIIATNTVFAVDYRGFVETGIAYKLQKKIKYGEYDRRGIDEGQAVIELGTTHGVQINKFLFLGGGADLNLQFDDYETLQSCNIFAAIRYDLCLEKKWSPFVNLKIGYNVKQPNIRTSLISSEGELILTQTGNNGWREWLPIEAETELLPLYLNISIGTRLRFSPKCGLNLSINYSPIIHKNEEHSGTYFIHNPYQIDHGWWVEDVWGEYIPFEHAKPNLKTGHLFGFNIGIDF